MKGLSTILLVLSCLRWASALAPPQRGLLHVLGLNKVPKVPKSWRSGSASSFMLNRFHPKGQLDADLSISFPDKAGVPGWLWFDLSDVVRQDILLHAEVHLHLDQACHVTLVDSTGHDVAVADATHSGWVTLNVFATVEHWLRKPVANFGLAIELRSPSGVHLDPRDVGFIGGHGPEEHRPFMVAYFGILPEEGPNPWHHRQRRSNVYRPPSGKYKLTKEMKTNLNIMKTNLTISDNTRKSVKVPHKRFYNHAQELKYYKHIYTKPNCTRYPFYVSFRDLNWQEWIIAPDGFEAGLCYGRCSTPPSAASNHALVQSMMQVFNPDTSPKICCIGTELSDINILYFDENMNVVMKTIKNMVINKCGCR